MTPLFIARRDLFATRTFVYPSIQAENTSKLRIKRRALSAIAHAGAAIALAFAFIQSAPVEAQAVQPFKWKSVNTQGMGYVTGIVIHEKAPYYRYVRTDVGGVFRFDTVSNSWVSLSDKYSRLQNEIGDIESIAVDNVNADRIWKAAPLGRDLPAGTDNLSLKGEVHYSDDRGGTWKQTGLAAKHIEMEGNGDFRGMAGERLLVDPFNAERVYFGSRKQGLWVRASGQWALAAGIPASVENPGVTFVVADRSAGALNGAAKVLYAGVYKSGVWRSDNGGVSWSLAVGSPNAYPLRAAVSSTGALFVTFGGDEGGNFKGAKVPGGVWRLSSGAWKNMLPNQTDTFSGVTIDPTNAQNVVVARGSGRIIFRSVNGGESWNEAPKTLLQNEPAYYPKPSATNYQSSVGEWGNAGLSYDPAAPGRVWQTNGFGVVYANDIAAANPVWNWTMNGLEELVVRVVKSPPLQTLPGTNEPGADMVSAVADMIGFRHASVDQVPSKTLAPIDFVAGATGIDYAGQRAEHMAFVGWDQDKGGWWAVRTGYSSDNGKTFTPFANTSPGSAGVIAMAADNPKNMVWAPSHWAKPQVTFDGGISWTVAKLRDGTDLPGTWKLLSEWWHGQVLVADRMAGGRFYYFDGYRFFNSTDGGKTWDVVASDTLQKGLAPWWTVATNVVVNPEKTGQLYITFAANSNQADAFKMFRSDNSGATFKPVATADTVNYLAFGRGDVTGTPYLYIHGRVNGATKDGVYQSRDDGASWSLISSPDENQFGKINTIDADMRKKNVVYIGTGGRGMFVGKGATVPPGYTLAVNTGGIAASNYTADAGATGGFTFTTDKPINRSAVEQAAPEAVYQSERYGQTFTYRSPVLAEGRRYLVRLHFAEIWWGVAGKGGVNMGTGQRVFDVTVSNMRTSKKVLTNFDVFKEAGGANKAIVKEFEASSDGTGTINFTFEAAANSPDRNAKISGIELIELGF